jgi:hypothetical protein
MAQKKSFIPRSYAKYDKFYRNICQYVTMMCTGENPQWTHIPQAEQTLLFSAFADWSAAYAKVLVPHTQADTAAVRVAFMRSKKVLSRFIQVWFRGFPDIVTADHLANMEIPAIDTTRTPIGKPATRPEFHIVVKDTRLLSIPFKDPGSESKAIPYGMNGAVVSWGIFDTPPTSFKMLGNADLATRSPYLLHFDEEERGKRVYITLQWENESGVRGDPAEMQMAIIP